MIPLHSYGVLACASFFFTPSSAQGQGKQPWVMRWSNTFYGPDGPWQAVSVGIGSPPQQIALYPAGVFQSHILTTDVCKDITQSPICYANNAGTYLPSNSSTSLTKIIQLPASTDTTGGGLDVGGSLGARALDRVDIAGEIVPNVSLALHSSIWATNPDGSKYAIEVGTLALGGQGSVNQTFTGVNPPINSSLIPGWLSSPSAPSNHQTPSNSFGLHIGSVSPRLPGSLYFGGYDQNRICGNISRQLGDLVTIDLLDVAITVVDGASPWNTSSGFEGLLKSGNASIGSSLPVGINPGAPYLNLPQSSCDAIAAKLPVTYQPSLGLYTWNVQSPQYKTIVSSASALSFIFRENQNNVQNFTIHVPFLLLNLTLTAPLVSTPTPYFPCNAQSRGQYQLGRAFLQAAFLGSNWNANHGGGVWWLAQAPGPNVVTQPSIIAIQDQDTDIKASENSWLLSWKDVWTPLAPNPASTSALPTSTPLESPLADSSHSPGPSTGAIAGIAVGSVAGFAVLLLALILFRQHRRRQRRRRTTYPELPTTEPIPSKHLGSEMQSPQLLSSDYSFNGVNGLAEVSGTSRAQELG
ncbi:MAG: hypothetical protein M1829_002459 [Trizodia sp. TS-e1964]|nr:MAG: hypothetical protein M1829_002459 [Trizodia sp. TS-e1964]